MSSIHARVYCVWCSHVEVMLLCFAVLSPVSLSTELPGPAANKTAKTAIWTISINYFRLYFQISDLQNCYKEAFPDVLVVEFKLSKSNDP